MFKMKSLKNTLSFWNHISVAKKLYLFFGLMTFLIGFELFILSFAMNIQSSVRAFIAGEGQWSKAQKDAINGLYKYIISKDSKHYLQFQKNLSVPLGDRKARLELEKKQARYQDIYNGFAAGNNHPDDIDGMIYLLQNFGFISYIKEAKKAWKAGDEIIDELIVFGNHLQIKIQQQKLTEQETLIAIDKIDSLNSRLTIEENKFSHSLEEGSRWLEHIILLGLLLLVITVEMTGLLFTFRFSQNLSKGLTKLREAAEKIGKGDFNQKVKIKSKDELGKLAQSLNQMVEYLQKNMFLRKQAEEANKTKSLFLANMSHEIRTPLSSIVGFTELLKKSNLSQDDKERYLNIIQHSGESLSNVINDILDISKVESGHLNLEKTNFSTLDLLKDLIEPLRLKCLEKGINLNLEVQKDFPLHIYSDPLRLRQILLNLLTNAIKFTKEGEISLYAGLEGNKLIFDVVDTGMGIPKKDQNIIFEHFRQSENSLTRKHGGTGLGLPLSQHLAILLGGELKLVESTTHFGSHFRASITYEKAKNAETTNGLKQLNSSSVSLKGLKILVAEDAEDLRLLIKLILEKHGCLVDFAEDGVVALEKVNQKKYDVILLDIQMPRMNGYDTISKLREIGISIPILAQTAHAMNEEKEKCKLLGFDEVITKPLMPEVLVDKLTQITKRTSLSL